MIDATTDEGSATTTTLTLARDGVTVTIAGVPAMERPGGDTFIAGDLAECISDAVATILDAAIAARTAPTSA